MLSYWFIAALWSPAGKGLTSWLMYVMFSCVFLWILFVIYVSCLSYCLVYSLQPCGHLLERAKLLALLYVMFSCVFDTFPCDILGQVWYLTVSIPDLCLLPLLHLYM